MSLDLNSKRVGVGYGGPKSAKPISTSFSLPGGDDLVLPESCKRLIEEILNLGRIITPRYVVIEQSLMVVDRDHSARAARVLNTLYGAAAGAGAMCNAMVVNAQIGAWRKLFIGAGNLPGDVAKKLANRRCVDLGWETKNHDESEAAGIWCWAMTNHFRDWTPPMPFGKPLLASGVAA